MPKKDHSPQVSVIVPMYNSENYIERCARSLFEQSLSDIEYIFVNDACTDNTVAVLEQMLESYPTRKPYTKIVSHHVNQGAVRARTTGLHLSTGKYIIFCDCDDWLYTDMLLQLYNEAEKGQHDLVYCNYYEVSHGQQKLCVQPKFSSGPSYIEAILWGKLGAYFWNKLIKRNLCDKLSFNDGCDMWEDLNLGVQLFFYAESVKSIDAPLYFYNQDNVNSIVRTYTSKQLKAMVENVRTIESFLDAHDIDAEAALLSRKVFCKLFMMSHNIEMKEWHAVFPEVNAMLCKSPDVPLYHRLIAWCLNNNLSLGYKLHLLLKRIIAK